MSKTKAKSKKRKSTHRWFVMRLTAADAERLQERAKSAGRSKSALLRELLYAAEPTDTWQRTLMLVERKFLADSALTHHMAFGLSHEPNVLNGGLSDVEAAANLVDGNASTLATNILEVDTGRRNLIGKVIFGWEPADFGTYPAPAAQAKVTQATKRRRRSATKLARSNDHA